VLAEWEFDGDVGRRQPKRGACRPRLAGAGSLGFTLVELMVTLIIVAVLAAVALPLYRSAPTDAKNTEAVAALGLVRGAMRAHHSEHGTYEGPGFVDGALVTTRGVLSISPVDLEGRYFSTECYTFDGTPTQNTFKIRCTGGNSTAPHADEVETVVLTIDQDGDIEESSGKGFVAPHGNPGR